jgi:hypothetical protein
MLLVQSPTSNWALNSVTNFVIDNANFTFFLPFSAAIIFDATSEKYKSIGGGAYEAGRKGKATTTKEVKMEVDDEEDQLMGGFMEEAQSSAGRKKKHRKVKGSDRGHGQKRRRESSVGFFSGH